MSLSRTITARRIALFSSSSFGLAAIISAASVGVAMTPNVAAAQSCTPDPATVAATPADDSVTCNLSLYPTGVTYTTNGDLTVTTTVDAAEWGGNGIVLDGVGADNITFGTALEIEGRSLVGALLDVSTDSGAINISTEEVDPDAHSGSGVTHAILAESATGAISITTTGIVSTSSGSSTATAIEARSAGDISITSTPTGNSAVTGRLYGIVAEAMGGGNLTVTHAGGIRANASDPNAITMDLTAGTGKLTVNSQGSTATIGAPGPTTSFAGTALRAVYEGDAEFNLNGVYANAPAGGSNWIMDLSTATGTTTAINLVGELMSSGFTSVGNNSQTLRVLGGGDLDFTVAGQLRGFLNLSGGGAIDMALVEDGVWRITGTTLFGAAADSLSVATDGQLFVSGGPLNNPTLPNELDVVTIDFAGGADRYVNAGLLMVGTGWGQTADTSISATEFDFRLLGLETFDNSGAIVMGGQGNHVQLGSDRSPDDILYMSGTTFTGSGDSLILLDVNLNGSQFACDGALRDANLNMPAADCIRIEDGATAGVTSIRVNELVPGDRGSFGEIVLVDVSGGTSDVGHFVLDPGSDSYSAAAGGVIDKGFFVFPLVYNAETQQHALVAAPGRDAQQFPLLAEAAHGLWRLSTANWLDRQADMRGGIEEGPGGGVWLRLATEFADREALQTIEVAGNPFTFDNTYEQSNYTVTGGADLVVGSAGDTAWVAGLSAGYAHSNVGFDTSANEMRLDGWTGGAYASVISGGLFIDGTLSANKLQYEGDVPALNLTPAGTMLATDLLSVGGQVEAGWRFPLGSAFVEPLAGVSYVKTEYDDLLIASDDPLRTPLTLEYDDPTSLRASVGARFGLDQDYGAFRAQYSTLGRFWNEYEGETSIVVHNTGDDAMLFDEFTGTFSEFGVGVSLYGMDGFVSGFFNFGGKFGDDYSSQNLSAGVRVNW